MSENPIGDDRQYPALPMVGVGAVLVRGGCLLMVRRAREPGRGKWSVPGGRVELGETLAEAARREVREECSVNVEIGGVLDATDAIVLDPDGRVRYHYVLVDLKATYLDGELKARSDADACRWIPLEEVAALDIPDSLRSVLKRNSII
ncbi:MAG: hypothetical protein A2Z29_09785 [Chloroflexi bacterium RBG_16_56_11]|nr:MAG: hypothetical protein A2Z29_09785 [Chloroflexi bacterium RBG_16_56_11]